MTTPTRLTPAQRDAAIRALDCERKVWADTAGVYKAEGERTAMNACALVVKRIAARLRALRGEGN